MKAVRHASGPAKDNAFRSSGSVKIKTESFPQISNAKATSTSSAKQGLIRFENILREVRKEIYETDIATGERKRRDHYEPMSPVDIAMGGAYGCRCA